MVKIKVVYDVEQPETEIEVSGNTASYIEAVNMGVQRKYDEVKRAEAIAELTSILSAKHGDQRVGVVSAHVIV